AASSSSASAPCSIAEIVRRACRSYSAGTCTRTPPSAAVSRVSVCTVCASASVAGMPSAHRRPRSSSASNGWKRGAAVAVGGEKGGGGGGGGGGLGGGEARIRGRAGRRRSRAIPESRGLDPAGGHEPGPLVVLVEARAHEEAAAGRAFEREHAAAPRHDV